ncbi:hypothetical protein BDU57DRAFT_454871 [Ampelomyces quisqualis]|uniref:Zinc-ribbon domain-containing protein n=1 Tax=Ampelomyces quisqualis TaxID=50730 RepID=A0A6A5QHK4_AMPQU|nr:hypothetical protein BDU57DRAFT_454871 [Ampelomyces quisqualis]
MQSTTVIVNSHNDNCPKCGAGISGDAKTCGSCGSVSSHDPAFTTCAETPRIVLPRLSCEIT